MKITAKFHRRHFLQTGLLGSAAWAAAAALPTTARGAITKTNRDPFHGLKIGIASYSLRKFPLDQAIAMTKQLGVRYITLKDFHLAMKSTREERQEAHRKIEAAGLVLMGGGVIYMKEPDEVTPAFEYAKDAGMPTIVASPDPSLLDLVEKTAQQYDIRVAIHNHGPGDPLYPSALDVLRLIKDRDDHLGICIDVGHTVRLGEDPIAVVRQCASRLYDFHIKDITAATDKGGTAAVGQGVIDIVALLKTLIEIKFSGHVALEYEANADAPMPGMMESFAYMRGVLAAID
jgi:inosose dehydratase